MTAAVTADVSELRQKPLRQSKMQNETGTISAPVSLTKQEGDKMIPKDARQVLQVGQKLQLKISAWNQAGQGVARYNGIPIFVSAALPGEIWETTITSVKKNYAQAALLKPEKTVEFRTTPRCSHYGVCGSCELQHMTYAATLRFKTEKVEQACRSIAKLDTTDVLQATLPSPVNQHYRQKLVYNFTSAAPEATATATATATEKKGTNQPQLVDLGFFAPNSHNIIPIRACTAEFSTAADVRHAVLATLNCAEIRQAFKRAGVKHLVYKEKSGQGLFKRLMLRSERSNHKVVLLTFVLNAAKTAYTPLMAQAFALLAQKLLPSSAAERGVNTGKRAASPDYAAAKESSTVARDTAAAGIAGIYLNFQPEKSNKIYSDDFLLLAGQATITETLHITSKPLFYTIGPGDFFQINPACADVLFQKALSCLKLQGSEVVYDLYCGTGSISLALAQQAKKVIGIEIVKSACVHAAANARLNGLSNVEFHCGAAGELFPRLFAQGLLADVVVVDPPRKGLDEQTIRTILQMGAPKVLYISCDPGSLARDLAKLTAPKIEKQQGQGTVQGAAAGPGRGQTQGPVQGPAYRIECLQPVDMFPFSEHIEVITLLSKLDSKGHINVELPIDEIDLTSVESKATYKQIQNYILEKFGLKVSTLYIAQVKRKYGLEVREHYNISKNENQKVLQCPIEKEEAILDALKYFRMIK